MRKKKKIRIFYKALMSKFIKFTIKWNKGIQKMLIDEV